MRTFSPAPAGKDPAALRRWLEERLETISAASGSKAIRGAAPTGWPEVDAALGGGLRCGAIHEWHAARNDARTRGSAWSAPLTLLAHLAISAARGTAPEEHAGWIAWIGRRVWPCAPALARMGGASILRRSLLVDPDSHATRLWAIDAAARCPAMVVVADGSAFDLAETRRLQLSAEAGGALALLARPRWERAMRSAASTRWEVDPAPPDVTTGAQRWEIHLTACKGARPDGPNTGRWLVEKDSDGALRVVPVLVVRSGETALAS